MLRHILYYTYIHTYILTYILTELLTQMDACMRAPRITMGRAEQQRMHSSGIGMAGGPALFLLSALQQQKH